MFQNIEDLDILEVCLRFLRWHQLWPSPGNSMKQPLFIVKAGMVLVFFGLTLCATFAHLHFSIQNPHTIIIIDVIEDLITTLVTITVYYTIYSMLAHKDEIEEFLEELKDFRRFGKPATIDTINDRCNKFAYAFYVYGCCGSTGSVLIALLEKSACEEKDVHRTRDCGFLMPNRYPVDFGRPGTFAITWCVQYISMMFFLNSGIIIMALIYGSCEIYATKIIHMREQTLRLRFVDDKFEARRHIKYLVDYHVNIIKMCKLLNKCWGSLMLYHQMLVSLILSLIGFQFLLEPNMKALLHAGGWFISLSIPCYAGQRVLDESMEIPMAIYSSEWYDLDKSTRTSLVYMIMCGNNYLYLDRDGYGPMSLSIVGQVVQNIYSVLALLHGTMNDEERELIDQHL